jgi:phosphonate transport system ATP-binding protein
MIEIRGLQKDYGSTVALRGIDLHIGRGQFVVLLGPSGAGKSTLLRCVNGLVVPTSGEVIIEGVPLWTLPRLEEVRKRVGMVFQQFNLVKRLTVLENVLCGCLAHNPAWPSCMKLFPPDEIEFGMQCLERVGLAEKAHQRADRLSGGQQQRVGIARALAQRPDIILADEPVASLDPRSAERVMDILREIHLQDGITLIVSLHNITLARQYAQRIVGIHNGCVVIDRSRLALTDQDVERIYGDADAEDLEVEWPKVACGNA